MTDSEKREVIQLQHELDETIEIINKFCNNSYCSECPFMKDWNCTIEKYMR